MKIMLVDGNALGYASQSANRLTHEGVEVQGLFGFLQTLRALRKSNPSHIPIVLWDGERNWRRQFYPEYKAQRRADPKMAAMREAYHFILPSIRQAVGALGIRQISDRASEADDLAYFYVERMTRTTGSEILLVTGDRDWQQLIGPQVRWYDPRAEGRECDAETFPAVTGFATTRQFIQAKALMGDTSDNVPGVGGIGPKTAVDLLLTFGSVENVLGLIDKPDVLKAQHKRVREFVTDEKGGHEVYRRNLDLMDLSRAPRPEHLNVQITEQNRDEFLALCRQFNFGSILREFSFWIQPFSAR
jgi:DNA polymerase-1